MFLKIQKSVMKTKSEYTTQDTNIHSLAHHFKTMLKQRGHSLKLLYEEEKQKHTFFAHNSRSFSYASLFFPPRERRMVERVYTFCRLTDDLVDECPKITKKQLLSLLSTWKKCCIQAYEGKEQPFIFLKQLTEDMHKSHVPLTYCLDLIKGIRMDIENKKYDTIKKLNQYSYCVASTVGMWLTELFGVHDPVVLEKAKTMGYAMQLTNILRDVGEDIFLGRFYIPKDQLQKHFLSETDVKKLYHSTDRSRHSSNQTFMQYEQLLKELISLCRQWYHTAKEGIPFLPSFFQRPTIVAAVVYEKILDQIESNRYNNLSKRATTSFLQKISLSLKALWQLHHLNKKHHR